MTGTALQSYPLALRIFMRRFSLNKILFKTPEQNIGALRVKDRLGIRRTGKEVIGFSIIKEGTPAVTYEITPDELAQL